MGSAEGQFVWADLTAPDAEAAAEFYRELLGWEIDRDESEMGTYLIGEVDGRDAAGIMAPSPDDAGAPPMWAIYLASDDLEATLAQNVDERRARVDAFVPARKRIFGGRFDDGRANDREG